MAEIRTAQEELSRPTRRPARRSISSRRRAPARSGPREGRRGHGHAGAKRRKKSSRPTTRSSTTRSRSAGTGTPVAGNSGGRSGVLSSSRPARETVTARSRCHLLREEHHETLAATKDSRPWPHLPHLVDYVSPSRSPPLSPAASSSPRGWTSRRFGWAQVGSARRANPLTPASGALAGGHGVDRRRRRARHARRRVHPLHAHRRTAHAAPTARNGAAGHGGVPRQFERAAAA